MPHHTLSLWNNYQLAPEVAAGLGFVQRSDMFAAIDNTVTLPGYTRADAAAVRLAQRAARGCRLNVENLFDRLLHQRRQQHQYLARISAGVAGRESTMCF